jgi:hypothetical protein
MSARATRRANEPGPAANSHQHANQPSGEQLHRENERLRRENEQLRREGDEREKQIADLERQLAARRKNSTNSSKPCFSDGLAGEQRPRGRKRKSKRKPGGQPGPGHHRPLVPAVEVNATEVLLLQQCRYCGEILPQRPDLVTTGGKPKSHQVTEVPPVKAHIAEYQFPNVGCGHCGKATQAPLPEEAAGQFGPQLTALVAYWVVVCRLPRRLVEAMLADVLGIEISLGSTQKAREEVS